MAKDFVKLSEVTVLEEVSDTASVLVEQNGEIYRAPKTQVGGAGGIKTAIIRDSGYLNAIEGMKQSRAAMMTTYECLNMTFEEAYETMANGEPLSVVGMIVSLDIPINVSGMAIFMGTTLGMPCIGISLRVVLASDIIDMIQLHWTADGLSTEIPGGSPQ